MESVEGLSPSSSAEDAPDCAPAPDSSRRTTHTGNQGGLSGLSYGLGVAWHHLRPFLPFFLISFMVVALIYLLQAIVYGGPFKDPLFFVKFYERWPRPTPPPKDPPAPSRALSTVPPPSSVQVLHELLRLNDAA